jgi:hypothetical protein
MIDIDADAGAHEPWFNQTLTSVRTVILMVEAAGLTPTGDDPT